MHVSARMALFCALFVAKSNASQAETLIGKVVGVTDGDTITVLNGQQTQHKIRLMGIDCPDMQPFSQIAKQSMSYLVFGRTVNVDWQKLVLNCII